MSEPIRETTEDGGLFDAMARAEALAAAWESYVQTRWGGWTEYAKVHTRTSGAADKAAFTAGWEAGRAR
jgi:hypothetical protein